MSRIDECEKKTYRTGGREGGSNWGSTRRRIEARKQRNKEGWKREGQKDAMEATWSPRNLEKKYSSIYCSKGENETLPSAVCRGNGGHSVLPVASALMKVFVYVHLLGERRARLCKQHKPWLEPASPSSQDTWEVSTRATVISCLWREEEDVSRAKLLLMQMQLSRWTLTVSEAKRFLHTNSESTAFPFDWWFKP